MIKNQLVFLREFAQEFESTGSVCPTSRWAASSLAKPITDTQRGPKRVLEIGPGTGSVTNRILECMIPDDHLSICEINPRLMTALKKNLEKSDNYQKHKKNIDFFQCAIQEIEIDKPFDLIVCALPFLNFDIKTVKEIFDKLYELSNESTLLTYYEYIGIRQLSLIFSPGARRERMKQLNAFFKSIHNKNGTKRESVWLNFTPIHVYTLQLASRSA